MPRGAKRGSKPVTDSEIISLYQSGETIRSIFCSHDVSWAHISDVITAAGIKRSGSDAVKAGWARLSPDVRKAKVAHLDQVRNKNRRRTYTRRKLLLVSPEMADEIEAAAEYYGETQTVFLREAVMRRLRSWRQQIRDRDD